MTFQFGAEEEEKDVEGLTLALKCFSSEATHIVSAHSPPVTTIHTVPPKEGGWERGALRASSGAADAPNKLSTVLKPSLLPV